MDSRPPPLQAPAEADLERTVRAALQEALESQPRDPLRALIKCLEREAGVGSPRERAETQQPASVTKQSANATKCWVLAQDKAGTPCKIDGKQVPCKLYVGQFADQTNAFEGNLTAHMQLVHSSGVDPADIRGCGGVHQQFGVNQFGVKFGSTSMYNSRSCREVLSGLHNAGLDLNNKAVRTIMAELTGLVVDTSTKEAVAEVPTAAEAMYRDGVYTKVGTVKCTSGSPTGDYVWMVVQGRMFYGPHEPDADGSRSSHMKQCMAIGCDPSDVTFAGSVRGGIIQANSLFNSAEFKTALSALDRCGVLDTPGGHAARGQLQARLAMTPCKPDQMGLAAKLLSGVVKDATYDDWGIVKEREVRRAPVQTTDEMMSLRKLGREKMGYTPTHFNTMVNTQLEWKLRTRRLSDEDIQFVATRAESSGMVARVQARIVPTVTGFCTPNRASLLGRRSISSRTRSGRRASECSRRCSPK